MKTLRLKDGDLSIDLGRRLEFVRGRDKLLQDLKLWLLEPLGTGFTTPSFGSLVEGFIGSDDPEEVAADLAAEIRRVILLYQRWQLERITAARTEGTLGYWTKSEIIEEIVEVKTRAVYDTVEVKISLKTLTGDRIIELSTELSPQGVSVV